MSVFWNTFGTERIKKGKSSGIWSPAKFFWITTLKNYVIYIHWVTEDTEGYPLTSSAVNPSCKPWKTLCFSASFAPWGPISRPGEGRWARIHLVNLNLHTPPNTKHYLRIPEVFIIWAGVGIRGRRLVSLHPVLRRANIDKHSRFWESQWWISSRVPAGYFAMRVKPCHGWRENHRKTMTNLAPSTDGDG